jgi:hypothetical protein
MDLSTEVAKCVAANSHRNPEARDRTAIERTSRAGLKNHLAEPEAYPEIPLAPAHNPELNLKSGYQPNAALST